MSHESDNPDDIAYWGFGHFRWDGIADIIGDTIEASLILDSGSNVWDNNAISGTAEVVDPGREYQAEVLVTPNGVNVDAYIDISDTELIFGLVRTDSSNGDLAMGGGRTLTLSIWDIDWTGSPIGIEYLDQFTFGDSRWEGDPADYLVTTTAQSIEIEMPAQIDLGGDGGEVALRYAISAAPAIPEPGVVWLSVIGFMGVLGSRNRRMKVQKLKRDGVVASRYAPAC